MAIRSLFNISPTTHNSVGFILKMKKQKYLKEVEKIADEEYRKVEHHINLCFKRFANRVLKLEEEKEK